MFVIKIGKEEMMRKKWLLIILPIVFFGCRGDELKYKPNETPTPISTPTPVSTQKLNHTTCIPSSSVEELGMSFPLESEFSPGDVQERLENFQDTLSINAEIVNKENETDDPPLNHIRLVFHVRFNNLGNRNLIIFEPLDMILEYKFEFLHVWVETLDGKKFGPLWTTTSYFIYSGDDFFLIKPGGEHCKVYDLRLPYAEGDSIEIQGREIPKSSFLNPGLHRLKITYDNDINGFYDYELNPWIGKVETEWISFTIP